MASSTPTLEVRDAVKSYGEVKALQGVSMRIEAGQFMALLGPNGAGKSTLFQLLSGLFVPDAGAIAICGEDFLKKPTIGLAKLGVVFQQPTLDLDLSVTGNLRFHAALHGLGAEGRARIAPLLAQVGLGDAGDKICRTLSGGNRRKVELARALLHRPALLLMDEATVGLDPQSRTTLMALVKGLCRDQGLAVLWATHLVNEAEAADRVYVLHKGRKLTEGTPTEVVAASGCASLEEAFLKMTVPPAGAAPGGKPEEKAA
ncbi:ABC transporter ATP-binding protein [Nevskia sp.]|uniref:ABC transporter ATP-binding protein n=1 Tax=Nevskia sp. TaxID=1929292 RepID=UPI0025E24A6D|nr:ABC transporter ATP-binding protein [Nevskia sp.]